MVNIKLVYDVDNINYRAFYKYNLLRSIKIPDYIESIEQSAFAYCLNLRKVIMSDNITFIGKKSF